MIRGPVATSLAVGFLAVVALGWTLPPAKPRAPIRLSVVDPDARTLAQDPPLTGAGIEAGVDEIWIRRRTTIRPAFVLRDVHTVTFALRRDERFFTGAAVAPWVEPATAFLVLDLGEPLGVDRFIDDGRPSRIHVASTLALWTLGVAWISAVVFSVRAVLRRVRSAAGGPADPHQAHDHRGQ